MKARVCLLLACTAAGPLALPAGATAKPGYVVKPKGLHLNVTLPASNGYSASLRTSGHRQVVLSLSQGSYQIKYTTLGRITRSGISADFGHFGHVSLRFRGQLRSQGPHPGSSLRACKGRPSEEERGVFLGNVRFSGERGFTRIKARRVKGEVVQSYKRICRKEAGLDAGASSSDGFEGKLLYAVARADGTRRSFFAAESSVDLGDGSSFGLALVAAALEEKVEGVAIWKSAFILDETVFHLSPSGSRPVETRVVPSWPFVGAATFLADGSPPTWTGPLGVRFPGSGQVSLAGTEFEVDLCRATSLSRFKRCTDGLQSLRLPLADSPPRLRLVEETALEDRMQCGDEGTGASEARQTRC